MRGPGPASQTYLPALDGLRAVSILLVVLSHAGLERVLPGAFGVTLFFFISGLLITRQLLAGLEAHGGVGLGRFYLRRGLRLLPAGLVYVVVAGTLFGLAGGGVSLVGWVCALFYGANFHQLWGGYRSVLPGVRHPFTILWSLAIEEHFYLVWPCLLGLLWRRRVMVGAVLALCLAALVWRAWLFGHCFGGEHWGVCGVEPANLLFRYSRLYLGTDTRFDSILYGALLALLERRVARRSYMPTGASSAYSVPAPPSPSHRFATGPSLSRKAGEGFFGGAGLVAAGLLLGGSFLPPGAAVREVLRPSMQGVALLVLVPACVDARHWLRRVLSSAPAVLMGRLSYSLYLWHWGAFALADWAWPGDPRRLVLLGLPLAWGLAVLSYLYVEQPMLRLRRRFGSHAPLDVLGGSPIGFGETRHAATPA